MTEERLREIEGLTIGHHVPQELIAEVRRLRAELQQERDDAFTEAEHWQQQVARLRAALRQYAAHTAGCKLAVYDDYPEGSRPCSCGLAEALEGAQEAKE